MRVLRWLTACAGPLLLAGCFSIPGTVQAPDYEQIRKQVAEHTAQLCEDAGFDRGSTEHETCVTENRTEVEQDTVHEAMFDRIDEATGRVRLDNTAE